MHNDFSTKLRIHEWKIKGGHQVFPEGIFQSESNVVLAIVSQLRKIYACKSDFCNNFLLNLTAREVSDIHHDPDGVRKLVSLMHIF